MDNEELLRHILSPSLASTLLTEYSLIDDCRDTLRHTYNNQHVFDKMSTVYTAARRIPVERTRYCITNNDYSIEIRLNVIREKKCTNVRQGFSFLFVLSPEV
jgi:hypothetical protein